MPLQANSTGLSLVGLFVVRTGIKNTFRLAVLSEEVFNEVIAPDKSFIQINIFDVSMKTIV